MRLGISSYAFGWAVGVPGHPVPQPFDEKDLLAFAARADLKVIQLGDHVPLATFPTERLDALRIAAKRAGISIEIGARGLTETQLERFLDIAARLNAPLLRFVIDQSGHLPEPDWVVGLLRTALPRLRAAGVVLGIENHDRFPCRVLRRMMDEIGDAAVGICLDTANSLGAGEGVREVVEALAECTVNLHLKDVAITRVPYAMGFVVEGAPAGRGMIDFAWVRDAVAARGRCRTAILETWVPPERTLELTLQKERRWAEASVEHLKTLFPA